MDKTYLELLCSLIRLHPETDSIADVNNAVNRMRAFLEKDGIPCITETLEEDGRQILYASAEGRKDPDILMCCHLDVVPASEPGQYEPFEKDGFLYARGAGDCLGNAVASAIILKKAKEEGLSVGCIFSTDEEVGGLTSLAMVKKGYTARRAGLILDGALCDGHKGVLIVKLTAHGRGGHSSAPWHFENPIPKLMKEYLKFESQWKNPSCHDDWTCSLAPCIVQAGSVENQIPDTAEMILNFRIVKQGDDQKILKMLEELTEGLTIETVRFCEPFEAIPSPEKEKFLKAWEKGFGSEAHMVKMTGATDARHLQKIGKPVYIFGTFEEGAHAIGEKLDLSSVDKVVNTVLAFAGN